MDLQSAARLPLRGRRMERVLSGEVTVEDRKLLQYMKRLMDTEGIFLEPSACAGFACAAAMAGQAEFQKYVKEHGLEKVMKNSVQIVWATGGSLVPEKMRREYLEEARIVSFTIPGFPMAETGTKGICTAIPSIPTGILHRRKR